MAQKKETAGRGILPVRLPANLHDELRAYKFFTNRPINDVVVDLIRQFLDGPGREEIAAGMTTRAKDMHGVALDKLAGLLSRRISERQRRSARAEFLGVQDGDGVGPGISSPALVCFQSLIASAVPARSGAWVQPASFVL
jgi:hypothetical protein